MRSVSLVKRLNLDFSGNLSSEAILLADIDNDGSNELVIGNVDGELAVFKGTNSKPWRSCSGLGMITCVGAGDVLDTGANLLVCTTAEGWCYVFDVEHVGASNQSSDQPLVPVYSQQLSTSCKALLLGKIDGNGSCQLMSGHTDRTLCLYQWVSDLSEHDSELKEKGKAAVGKDSTKSSKESSVNAEKQHTPGKDASKNSKEAILLKGGAKKAGLIKSFSATGQDKAESKLRGCFVCLSSWTVPFQIGSLVSTKIDGLQCVMASQPGGTFITIVMPKSQDSAEESGDMLDGAREASVHAVGSRNQTIRNPTLMTLVTQRQHNEQTGMEEETSSIALCTQDDGTVKLLRGTSRFVWSTSVDETCKLFALSKLDICGDKNEQVIACTWDGQTYIIDHLKSVVKFAFGENVMAFLAGSYAVTPGQNSPCLVYVTFSNQVVIYWDLMHAFNAPSNNLIGAMNSSFTECRDVVGSLGKMTPSGKVDQEMLRKLYAWCLYSG